MTRPVQRDPDEWLAHRIKIGAGEHRLEARRLFCRIESNRNNASMRMRAAHEAQMQHAGKLDVVYISPAAAEQARQFTPRHPRADARVICCCRAMGRHLRPGLWLRAL